MPLITSRRSFVFGSVAAAVAFANSKVLALPAPDKIPIPDATRFQSAIFPYQAGRSTDSSCWMIQARDGTRTFLETGTFPEMALSIYRHIPSDPYLYGNSLDTLEMHYMHACSQDFSEERLGTVGAIYELERSANRISRNTRRGRGNRIIIHPEVRLMLQGWWSARVYPYRGIHEREWMPRDRVFTFYRGNNNYDAAGVLRDDNAVALNEKYFHYGRMTVFKKAA